MAREGSHQADAILVPAASRAGRQEEKIAAVALDEVAVSIPLVANCPPLRPRRRSPQSQDAGRLLHLEATLLLRQRRAETAEDRQAEDREVEPAGVSGGAAARGQAQATNQRLRARYAATGFAAYLHPGALKRVSPALEPTSEMARKQVQATRVQKGVASRARASCCGQTSETFIRHTSETFMHFCKSFSRW